MSEKNPDFAERTHTLLFHLKMNKAAFANKIGITPQMISNVSEGKTKPSVDFLAKILETYTDINPRWLILGEGDMWEKEKPASINLQVQNNHTVDSTSITHEQKASYAVDAFGQCQKEVEMLKSTLRDKDKIIQLLEQQLQK